MHWQYPNTMTNEINGKMFDPFIIIMCSRFSSSILVFVISKISLHYRSLCLSVSRVQMMTSLMMILMRKQWNTISFWTSHWVCDSLVLVTFCFIYKSRIKHQSSMGLITVGSNQCIQTNTTNLLCSTPQQNKETTFFIFQKVLFKCIVYIYKIRNISNKKH